MVAGVVSISSVSIGAYARAAAFLGLWGDRDGLGHACKDLIWFLSFSTIMGLGDVQMD